MSLVIDESFAEVWERTIQPCQADLPTFGRTQRSISSSCSFLTPTARL